MENAEKNVIGVLMKETGMSIVMTSINNILSFLAGTLLPIPALRSFCAQVCGFFQRAFFMIEASEWLTEVCLLIIKDACVRVLRT